MGWDPAALGAKEFLILSTHGGIGAAVFRRLIRSLPTRRGVIGVATCDKGLPANRQTPRIGFVLLLRSLL